LTIQIDHDFTAAAASDDLKATVDYYALTRRLLRLGEGRSWKLLERLAVEIAGLVLEEPCARKVTVEVQKFVLPETRYVGVRVIRP
jgi:FolB domain-containing protein